MTKSEFVDQVASRSDLGKSEAGKAVDAVLKEIGADGKPTLMVVNKVDQLNGNRDVLPRFLERHPNAVAISATEGAGLPVLMAQLGAQLRPIREFLELSIPHDRPDVVARLHDVAQVVERRYTGKTAQLKARIPPHLHEEFAPFIVRGLQTA